MNTIGTLRIVGLLATAMALAACKSTPPEAPAPAPEPVVAPQPQVQRLASDNLFAFGRASLRDLSAEGRAALDELAHRLTTGRTPSAIVIVGHSDRIGNAAVNQRISQQRADSVAEYLSSKGVYPELISTEGRGASEPLVDCDKERGQRLIECLAPNRRVEIQVQFGS